MKNLFLNFSFRVTSLSYTQECAADFIQLEVIKPGLIQSFDISLEVLTLINIIKKAFACRKNTDLPLE